MLNVSTYFIKDQLPGISLERLIKLYSIELNTQAVDITRIESNIIYFENNNTNILLLDRTADNFHDIAEGQITIEETDTEFLVYLDAKATNPLGGFSDKLFFPLYFESLRNNLEEQLRCMDR